VAARFDAAPIKNCPGFETLRPQRVARVAMLADVGLLLSVSGRGSDCAIAAMEREITMKKTKMSGSSLLRAERALLWNQP
jgi:hypothetical protein